MLESIRLWSRVLQVFWLRRMLQALSKAVKGSRASASRCITEPVLKNGTVLYGAIHEETDLIPSLFGCWDRGTYLTGIPLPISEPVLVFGPISSPSCASHHACISQPRDLQSSIVSATTAQNMCFLPNGQLRFKIIPFSWSPDKF